MNLYKFNFGKADEFIEYRALTWDDFKGPSKPFSRWGAGISSYPHLKYDSTTGYYTATAKMNRTDSWKKRNLDSEYTLRHEQYHFNLTHYYSIILNKKLSDVKSIHEASKLLNTNLADLTRAQTLYDAESEHGRKVDMQRYWEFKIDSLLYNAENVKKNIVRELYADLEFYKFGEPKKEKTLSRNGTYQIEYVSNAYGLDYLVKIIGYDEPPDLSSFEPAIRQYYQKDSVEIIKIQRVQGEDQVSLTTQIQDSIKSKTFLDKWILSPDYLHSLRLAINDIPENNEGYERIFEAVSPQFKMKNMDSSWIRISEHTEILNTAPITKYDKMLDHGCLLIDTARTYGWIRNSIKTDENFLLPYAPFEHADSTISEVIVLYNEELYTYDLNDSLVIKIPISKLKTSASFFIGYTLKADTVNECQRYFNLDMSY